MQTWVYGGDATFRQISLTTCCRYHHKLTAMVGRWNWYSPFPDLLGCQASTLVADWRLTGTRPRTFLHHVTDHVTARLGGTGSRVADGVGDASRLGGRGLVGGAAEGVALGGVGAHGGRVWRRAADATRRADHVRPVSRLHTTSMRILQWRIHGAGAMGDIARPPKRARKYFWT